MKKTLIGVFVALAITAGSQRVVSCETEQDIQEEIYYDSLEYLAQCVQAEANTESDLGKRLVCDVIINRYKEGKYTNYYDVINEKGQFACVSNGSINSQVPSDNIYKIVSQELKRRTNNEVKYFRTGKYHKVGTPLFKEGAHYFSK